jgi:hypothetical protein
MNFSIPTNFSILTNFSIPTNQTNLRVACGHLPPGTPLGVEPLNPVTLSSTHLPGPAPSLKPLDLKGPETTRPRYPQAFRVRGERQAVASLLRKFSSSCPTRLTALAASAKPAVTAASALFALSRSAALFTETGASQRLLPVRLASPPLQLLLLPEPPISQARGDLAFGLSHHYHHEDWRFSAPASCPTYFRCPPLQPDPR